MAHQPAEKGERQPLKPPVGEQEEADKEPHAGPGAGIETRGAKDDDSLPHSAQNRDLIAMDRLRHYKVAPATRPNVPSMAVPPPKMRRLRGRSYPRSLASELYVRVSPHTAQAWNNAPRYPVRTSIRDTVSIRSPCWRELAYDNWDVQERCSLPRCFHLS